MASKIKPGDRCAIINKSLGGFFLEGFATVIQPANFDRWLVQFGDPGEPCVYRFIDPAAQADPEAYVARLNRASITVEGGPHNPPQPAVFPKRNGRLTSLL